MISVYFQVKSPMDLSTMSLQIESYKYKSIYDFLRDCTLMKTNAELFWGPDSVYSKEGRKLLLAAIEILQKVMPVCTFLRVVNVPWGVLMLF